MLTQSSNIFQRIAIGWEQMEYEKTDSSYKDYFTSAKFRMKTVNVSNKIQFSVLTFSNELFYRRCVSWMDIWLIRECLRRPIRPDPLCQMNCVQSRAHPNGTNVISAS
jgi:hypothetical protein